MTLLYTSDVFLQHQTGPGHPECPQRLEAIVKALDEANLPDRCRRVLWRAARERELQQVHSAEYLVTLEHYALQGGGRLDADTVVSGSSLEAAQLAAGAACDAVGRVCRGEDTNAMCLIRPPGHHALPTGAMGFCLVNNVAIAARWALTEQALDRVLIVDWDVHHGNGTQDTFYEDPQVAFFSIHRSPFYPGTGALEETGTGDGLGLTLNRPLPETISRQQYHAAFARDLEEIARRSRPQLILVSAGYDAHKTDPIGSLGLETEDFAELTRLVLQVAQTYCQGRTVLLLEGGYNLNALAESVVLTVQTLLETSQAP